MSKHVSKNAVSHYISIQELTLFKKDKKTSPANRPPLYITESDHKCNCVKVQRASQKCLKPTIKAEAIGLALWCIEFRRIGFAFISPPSCPQPMICTLILKFGPLTAFQYLLHFGFSVLQHLLRTAF